MEGLSRVLSRPVAKPYRSKNVRDEAIHLNDHGLLDFAENDIENPKNWSTPRRWYITFAAVLLTVNASFASSGPSGCLEGIAEDFGVTIEVAGLVITLFLLGYVAGPLVFAPLSEFYGRRWIFYLTFTAYIAFTFLCAFTPSFAGLLVGRFFTGTLASAAISNSPGVLADIWGPVERGSALALFSMMTFAGPALAPVISGFLQVTRDWRWSFYVLLWLAALTLPFMFTLPETLPSQVLLNKAIRIRKAKIPGYENVQAPVEVTDRTLIGIFKVALLRPWIILFDTISFLCAIYLSVVYLLLYMLFSIYPIVFQQRRGWNAGVGELPLIGFVIGAWFGGSIVFYNSHVEKKKTLAGFKRKPEDRLPLAMIGGIIFPISMFWFGWSAEYNSVPWIIPTIAGGFLATSIMLIFVAYLNYITDSYLMYAASALAANTVVRSAAGAAAPLFTNYMFEALGVGGGASLIGGVGVLLAPIPFVFYRYGEAIRKKSKFAPTDEDDSGSNTADDEEKQTNSSDGGAHKTRSQLSTDQEEERELDDIAGVPSEEDLAKDIEHEREKKQVAERQRRNGDPYLDGRGQEKTEQRQINAEYEFGLALRLNDRGTCTADGKVRP